ncbi:MAG: M23 family metallopeptidase [Holophagales bacterium]|nr:M23 family metallopeptidase [Holophagales bacterium]
MKQHTIIFVPHARAKFRKWRLSTLQVGLSILSIALLTLTGIVSTVLYFDTSFDRGQLDRIQQENVDLRAVNQRFEASVREMEGQLTEYQKRIQQLAIVAGLSDLRAESEPGIGGMEPPGDSALPSDDLEAIQAQLEGLVADMEIVEESLGQRRAMLSSMPTVAPVKGIFTSAYGMRKDPFTGRRAMHHGIDISAPFGREVVAPGDGMVIKAGRAAGYGNVVYLSHGFGVTTRFGHLSKVSVEVGQKVERGDVLGKVGNTGRSTGIHLHYEVRVNGKAENPLGYILDSIRP